MKKYPDFWHVLIGAGPLGTFLGFVVIALICAIIRIGAGVIYRDISNPNTPDKLSMRYLFADNLFRFIINLFCIPIFIRVIYEYVSFEWMLLFSVGIGFGVDKLAAIAKQYGLLTTNNLANKIAEKLKDSDTAKNKNNDN